MNNEVPERRFPPDTEPRLLRFKVNGTFCLALKWSDERTEYRREINYVLREVGSKEIRCLLVDAPLRITGFPDLVSVQFIGRTMERAETIWEFALTVWADGDADDEGMVRTCPPETFPDRSQYLRDDLTRMIGDYDHGRRKCYSPAVPTPVVAPPAGLSDAQMDALRQTVEPVLEQASKAFEAVESQTRKTRELTDKNAVLQKAADATSAEIRDAISLYAKDLTHPRALLFELRWVRGLSLDRMVAELRRRKIQDCRTKKRVSQLLKEMIANAKAKGFILAERVTGPQPSGGEATGYDEATGGVARVSTRTAVDDLIENEESGGVWGTMEREDRLTTIDNYRKASPADQKTMREYYGAAFREELSRLGL